MNYGEIAMKIVIAAMETKNLALLSPECGNDEELDKANAFNATQISKFYAEVYKSVHACRLRDE